MILTLLKLGLLLVSYFGWWEFFRSRCRMNVYFVPAFTIAAQFTVLFLPGLLNFLPEAAWALYLGGFVLLADALKREKLGFVKHYINWGYLLLFVALAAMALVFRGKVVTWLDNFHHWATAVKNMLAVDQFPSFARQAVTFSTYPLGSTAMIWYFCNFTSPEEDFWMLAQGFMMLCMVLPLFAYNRKKGILPAIFLALTGNFLLCYNTPLTELLVDTLLPLAGMAAILFVSHECLREEDPLDPWFALPVLLWVMNIKNAGMLFLAGGLLILLAGMKKQHRNLKPLALIGLVLLVSYFLWERHCDYLFYQNTVAQHEISLEYFKMRLSDKSLADCGQIALRMLKAMILRRELTVVLGLLALLWAVTWLLAPEQKKQLIKLSGFLGAMFGVYAVSLIAMYISSMSLEGAMELQSADRYIRIWEMAAVYLMAAYGVSLVDRVRRSRILALVLAAGMAYAWLGAFGDARTILDCFCYEPQKRVPSETLIADYGVQSGMSYLLCAEEDVILFERFFWMYQMDSNRVHQMKVEEESQMEVEKYYDYVVILDENNPVIESWVAKTYPDQLGKQVIQCFK